MIQMKKSAIIVLLLSLVMLSVRAQERIVRVDFESGTFLNNPQIPFSEPFAIQGEAGSDIEFVKVEIYYAGKSHPIHTYTWNRSDRNPSESFSVVVPAVLKSNTDYDFRILTYKKMTKEQRQQLSDDLEKRIRYYLQNNIYYDGKRVTVNGPKNVFKELKTLMEEALRYHESKNGQEPEAPSRLVLDELKKQSDFRFKAFFRRSDKEKNNEAVRKLIDDKVDHLVGLCMSELRPYLNNNLVQQYRMAFVRSVSTDKEPFTLPVNVGMYAWNKSASLNDVTINNTNLTLGAGLTIPFKNKSYFASKMKFFDSFGYSIGVLVQPVKDASGNEFVTPGIKLPVYTGLGFRMLKVVRVNAGVIILGEYNQTGFSNVSVIPTAGLALELNLWMGVK
ncbi:MAG: hypothetical protein ACQES0_10015 [Bacteroidota bacterium]